MATAKKKDAPVRIGDRVKLYGKRYVRGTRRPGFAGKFTKHFLGVGVLLSKTDPRAHTPGECYVTCLDLIPTVGVRFAAGNSWRGDHFEPELREAIANPPNSGGAVRCGPFAIPLDENDRPVGVEGQK